MEIGSQPEVLMPRAHGLVLRGGLRVLPRGIEENTGEMISHEVQGAGELTTFPPTRELPRPGLLPLGLELDI